MVAPGSMISGWARRSEVPPTCLRRASNRPSACSCPGNVSWGKIPSWRCLGPPQGASLAHPYRLPSWTRGPWVLTLPQTPQTHKNRRKITDTCQNLVKNERNENTHKFKVCTKTFILMQSLCVYKTFWEKVIAMAWQYQFWINNNSSYRLGKYGF